MKSILISIKPKYVADILNGKKTIEIRKTMPKCDLPIDVYIYCTKDNKNKLCYVDYEPCGSKGYLTTKLDCEDEELNGKVVAKFTLNQVERFDVPYPAYFSQVEKGLKHITDNSCLTLMKLHHYLKNETGYAWHISNLVIFDKPKELIELKQPRDSYGKVNWNANDYYYTELTKAPQSWCYVETEDK